MLIRLFDVTDGALVPSEACYTLPTLKGIMDAYPDKYLKIYLYIYYMTYPDPGNNPFFNLPEIDKEELIIQELKINFSLDNPLIPGAIDFCNRLYDTPTKRAYRGIKIMMDKLAKFFETKELSTGRDGSLTAMMQSASKFHELWESFKGVEKEYLDEVKAVTRGGAFEAYDMK